MRVPAIWMVCNAAKISTATNLCTAFTLNISVHSNMYDLTEVVVLIVLCVSGLELFQREGFCLNS